MDEACGHRPALRQTRSPRCLPPRRRGGADRGRGLRGAVIVETYGRVPLSNPILIDAVAMEIEFGHSVSVCQYHDRPTNTLELTIQEARYLAPLLADLVDRHG